MTAAEVAAKHIGPGEAAGHIDYRRIGLISAGHFTNDLYGNLITALMPYLVLQGRISATLAGFILLTYLFGSSILQPVFGLISDRTGRRLFVAIGPLWVGLAAAAVGWAPGPLALFVLAGFGGIGTAAFHPQAASMVDRLSTGKKGWTMSLFSMGGNLGFALGPLVAAALALAGLHWTAVIILPGIALTVLLAMLTPRREARRLSVTALPLRSAVKATWRSLSLIVAVIATRSSVQYALIIFLPLYYHARGGSAEIGSYYAFVLSLAGAVGGLLGGRLSDTHGRKLVVVSSLALSTPLLFLTLVTSGPAVWPLLAASGALLLASNSVTVVQGQELLPASTGVASGLTLGFGFGLSGVLASVLTALSDHIGVTDATRIVPFVALLAAVLALGVSSSPSGRESLLNA